MVPFLQPLRESIWLHVTLLALLCGLSSISIWLLLTAYLSTSLAIAGLITSVSTLVIAVLLGKVIADSAVAATDFLARSILLVTNEKQVSAPDPKVLTASKDFLINLAKSIYCFAHPSRGEQTSTQNSNQLEFFRTLANTLPLPAITINKNQQINFANKAACKYLEKPAEDVIGRPVFDALDLSFVSDFTLEAWQKNCFQNAAVQDEIWERVRLNLPDSKRKQFDMSAHYSNNDPNGLETTIVFFDKTVQYERDDHDLTFVALAVHELRTPLTIMRGYVEVFEDELRPTLNNEQNAFMHNMNASASQLSSFVSNMLNVARVEENALNVNLKEENWKDTLMAVCKDMELRTTVHGKKLVYEIADHLPTVAIDKTSIYEVMMNIIDNAIKYTHTDEEIIIHAHEKDDMVETCVVDRGVGIATSVIPHVFDKFYRGHRSKNSTSGTGLGLYLSRAIINAHGGNIWVKSKEGEGSTFGFTVPIYASVADQIKNEDNKGIVRGAHGWIKNHSLYRE